ncbi:flagellar protein FlaG [Alkaliphilus hydrothermalis]|uniref:Flagellar protein FlaG n=1 Tax=Alkaliphilus hydrothermalis TaxID=1482730 RepID=A0ABS2NR05_9FIRM|nr:flagellar protein FlaG [Alkaliphilus hydrothermalis]MBM7615393.1 flagellar protein FlaG [Alkaliphilus hydrothermalis]
MKIDGVQAGNAYPLQTNALGQGSRIEKPTGSEQAVYGMSQGEKQISEEKLVKAVEKANKSFEPFDRRFEISIHEKTKAVVVKVFDSTNDQLIREIPNEKLLDMVAHMLEVAGIIVDKTV